MQNCACAAFLYCRICAFVHIQKCKYAPQKMCICDIYKR